MKIHAEVEIKDAKSGKCPAKGKTGKTFALGGMYGAMKGIEDLEKEFAHEVTIGFVRFIGLP